MQTVLSICSFFLQGSPTRLLNEKAVGFGVVGMLVTVFVVMGLSGRCDVPGYLYATRVAKGEAIGVPRHFNSSLEMADFLYSPAGMEYRAYTAFSEHTLAPLTAETQEAILAHQFRSEERCRDATFLALNFSTDHGIGSQWHVASHFLAVAMEAGRIFMWEHQAGSFLAQGDFCSGDRSWTCYLKSPTNCSRWAQINNTDTRWAVHFWYIATNNVKFTDAEYPRLREQGGLLVPHSLAKRLAKVRRGTSSNEIHYWWSAQATAFLARINDRTIRTLRSLRMSPNVTAVAGNNSMSAMVFPLPPGTISVHVRHGDKHKEMQLVPYRNYSSAVVTLQQNLPLSLQRFVFLSTEDPAVIADAATDPTGYTVYYSKLARENSNGLQQLRLDQEMTLKHILQLFVALECDGWVGTRGSNWNQLIDELRCVWIGKCNGPFVEVGGYKIPE